MKLSELIKNLNYVLKTQGDMDVFYIDHDEGIGDEIVDVEIGQGENGAEVFLVSGETDDDFDDWDEDEDRKTMH